MTMVMTTLVEPGFPWLISSIEDIINGYHPTSSMVLGRVGESSAGDPSAQRCLRHLKLFHHLGDGEVRTLGHGPNVIPCRHPGSCARCTRCRPNIQLRQRWHASTITVPGAPGSCHDVAQLDSDRNLLAQRSRY